MSKLTPFQMIEQDHANDLAQHPKAYFELAMGRSYGVAFWRTDESVEQNPNRTILAEEGSYSLRAYLLTKAGVDLEQFEDEEDWPSLSNYESDTVVKFVDYLDSMEDNVSSYSHMCIMHKGDMDWIIRIDTHHTVGHCQYFPLVRESARSLPELIEKAVAAIEASKYCDMVVTQIPPGTDTGVVCHFDEWEATAA